MSKLPAGPMNDLAEWQAVDRRELARRFVNSLRDRNAPWRYPHNRLPEFVTLFDKFFKGEPRREADTDYAEVDAIIKAVGVRIKHHWNCCTPKYYRFRDRIVLPPRSYFQDEPQYHATRLHEVFHALERRVGWVGPGHQAELVAEIATGMTESVLQLPHENAFVNLDKWLPWWTMEITSEPAYLFDAVVQAERSVRYLLDLHRRREAA